jgi:hypothetical protein
MPNELVLLLRVLAVLAVLAVLEELGICDTDSEEEDNTEAD